MGVRNRRAEELERLQSKTLDAQFVSELRVGLDCSPVEARAVLDLLHEIYSPYMAVSCQGQPMPGRLSLVVVSADEPSGKPLVQCLKRTVCLNLHRGAPDDLLLRDSGPEAFRQARIPDLCQEALSQGGLLTREDLAYRIFFVSLRTISRDLADLRQAHGHAVIPLRSVRHDIGPVLTHRTEIVRLALEGKTTTEICRIMKHSPEAVANYVSTFIRCAQLMHQGLEVGQIAFLLRRGRGLVEKYLDLVKGCQGDKNRLYHLNEMLELGRWGEKKRSRRSK